MICVPWKKGPGKQYKWKTEATCTPSIFRSEVKWVYKELWGITKTCVIKTKYWEFLNKTFYFIKHFKIHLMMKNKVPLASLLVEQPHLVVFVHLNKIQILICLWNPIILIGYTGYMTASDVKMSIINYMLCELDFFSELLKH